MKQNLMAVIAEGMTFDAIDATPTAAARITFALKFVPFIFNFPILNIQIIKNDDAITFGPQRFCLVTQQISVRQTEQRTQSHPQRFIRTT
jgi:hypothetical protein